MINTNNNINTYQETKERIENKYNKDNPYAYPSKFVIGNALSISQSSGSSNSSTEASSVSEIKPLELIDTTTSLKELTGISINGVNLYSEAKLKESTESFKRETEANLQLIEKEIVLAQSENESEKVKDLEDKKEILQEQIKELNKLTEDQREKVSERKKDIAKDISLGGLETVKSIAQTATEEYGEALDVAQEIAGEVVGVGAEELLGVIWIIRKSSDINEALGGLKTLHQELAVVKSEIEKADQEGNIIEKNILELRVKHLETKIQDETFKVAKTIVSLLGSVAGTAVSTKAVLVAIGVSVGATVGTAASVTGIAAAVIAAVVVVGGLGFIAYKKRNTIAYAAQKVTLESQKYLLDKSSISKANLAISAATQIVESAEQQAQKSDIRNKLTHTPFMREAQILLNEIDQLKQSKRDYEVQDSDNFLTVGFKKLQVSLIDQKISSKSSEIAGLIMKTTEKALTIDTEVKKLKEVQGNLKKVCEKINDEKDNTDKKLEKVASKISKIDDGYTYGKHVAKFTSNPQDETVNPTELHKINDLIVEEINKDPKVGLQIVRELFSKQEERIESKADLTFFIREEQIEESEKGKFFNALVSAITL